MNRTLTLILTILAFASCVKQEVTKAETEYQKLLKATTEREVFAAKAYVTDSLDFVQLDTLGMRNNYIEAWLKLYDRLPENIAALDINNDSRKVIDRLAEQSPEQIKPFIRTVADYLVDYNRRSTAASIAAYPYGINIKPDERSQIAERLLTFTRLTGNPAPVIEGLYNPQMTPMLLLFYESDCPSCENMMNDLKMFYPELKKKGIRVVTVSCDGDRTIFDEYAAKMPWEDKLCDFQGFSGKNFERWGVAATPSMFFIDKDGVVKQTDNLDIKELAS